MSHLARLFLAASLLVAISSPASAADLTLDGTELSLGIATLPPISVPLNEPTTVAVDDATGGFALDASVFGRGPSHCPESCSRACRPSAA